MTHLSIYDGRAACGGEGETSSFIHVVNCGRCHAWNNTNELAKSLVGFSEYLEEKPIVDLAVCSCGCGDAFPKAHAIWHDGQPYLDESHLALNEYLEDYCKNDAFDEANEDMNARLYIEHKERLDG